MTCHPSSQICLQDAPEKKTGRTRSQAAAQSGDDDGGDEVNPYERDRHKADYNDYLREKKEYKYIIFSIVASKLQLAGS